jgi:peptide/nickel transport system substrate-binding protein
MCEPLLRQAPGGSLEPGLATVANPSPTSLVFTLRPGVRFWDVQPDTVLVLAEGLTGAISSSAYLHSPWASQVGGTG